MSRLRYGLLLIVIALVVPGVAFGGGMESKDSNGNPPNPCVNPPCPQPRDPIDLGTSDLHQQCAVPISQLGDPDGQHWELGQLFDCMENGLNDGLAAGGLDDDYLAVTTMTATLPTGIEIVPLGGAEEIEDICIADSDPDIQGFVLTTTRTDRIAKFAKFTEAPGPNGSVFVTLNGRSFSVPVAPTPNNPSRLTDNVKAAIESQGFDVASTAHYILVTLDKLGQTGIHEFELRYGPGTALVSCEMSLEPANQLDDLWCRAAP